MKSLQNLSLSLAGYNRHQVRSLIENYETDLSRLNERVDHLTAELEYYKNLEKALTEGIIDARVKGEEIVSASQTEADELVNRTNEAVIQYKEEFAHQSRELIGTGSSLLNDLNQMKAKMRVVVDQYQTLIDETDFDSFYPQKQVNQMLHQVNEYEETSLAEVDSSPKRPDANLSQAEKEELERLIQDVIVHDESEIKEKLISLDKKRNIN